MSKLEKAIAKIEAQIVAADARHSKASSELSVAGSQCNKLRGDLAKLKTWEAIGLEYGLIRKKKSEQA